MSKRKKTKKEEKNKRARIILISVLLAIISYLIINSLSINDYARNVVLIYIEGMILLIDAVYLNDLSEIKRIFLDTFIVILLGGLAVICFLFDWFPKDNLKTNNYNYE